YGGRFEQPDGGTIGQDVAIQENGGYHQSQYYFSGVNTGSLDPRYTPVARLEDDAGILFKLDPTDGIGYENITLSFDWLVEGAQNNPENPGDLLVVGYYVGDLEAASYNSTALGAFDSNNENDYYATLGHQGVKDWWIDDWNEIFRDDEQYPNGFRSETLFIADVIDTDIGTADEIWIAFWLDNGEHQYSKIDNIVVEATLIPEPSTALLLGFAGLLAKGYRGYRKRFFL
ncbi:MAG: hypothetical protein HKP10_06945, partial [Kiritimatiellales bacterium]|nr:hypothetical protein [Kiritimatiellales bacterium]